MVLLRPLFVASLGAVLVHADSTSANSSSSLSSFTSSPAAVPSQSRPANTSLASAPESIIEQTGASLPPSKDPTTFQPVQSAKADVQSVQDENLPQAPSQPTPAAPKGDDASAAPAVKPPAAPSPAILLAPQQPSPANEEPSVLQVLHIATDLPSPPTASPETQQVQQTQPTQTTDENAAPSPTAPETVAPVTPAPVLGGLISKFAALFAKTEQTALVLDGPQTTTASDEPFLNSVLSHNPVLSNIFRPLVAVTAHSGSEVLQGPGIVAPVVGGNNSPAPSNTGIGGMIASGINSNSATPAAPGRQNQIVQATPTTSLPGQLVNIAPSTPAPQSNGNTNQQNQQGGLSRGFVIGSETLAPGAAPQVISGTTFSLGPSASTLYINNLPYDIQASSNTYNNDLPYVLPGGSMVQPGGAPITVSGTTYSLAAQGSTLYVNGRASALPSPVFPNRGQPTPFIVNGHTISPGSSPVVIDGQTYSVAPATAGGALYVNGTKVADPQNFALLTMAMAALESALGYSSTTVASDSMLTLVSTTSTTDSSTTSPSSSTPSKGAAVESAVVGIGLIWGLFGAAVALL